MAAASTSWRGRWALVVLVAGYAVVGVLAAAPGSVLVPPFPPGAGPPSWLARLAGPFSFEGSPGAATFVGVALLTVLVVAFVLLLIEAGRGRVGIWAVAVAGGLALVIAVGAPLLLSRDVYSYAAYGRELSVHGSNPYALPPSVFRDDPFFSVLSPEWRSTRSVYGPAFTLLSAGITWLWRDSPAATVLAYKIVTALATAGAALLAAGAARRWGMTDRAAMAVAAVALNPVMVVHTVGGGHNDALVALGVAGAAWLSAPPRSGRRTVAVTAVLTLAALVKIVAAIPLALWLWAVVRTTPPRERVRASLPHAGVIGVLTVALTWPVFAGWRTVTAIANLASRQGWASASRLIGRGAQALDLPGAPTFVFVAALLLFAVGVVLLELRVPADDPTRWGRALILFALLAPYLLPWYVAWFVPLLALMGNDRTAWIGFALGFVLALTGIPAEPGPAPGLWRDMLLLVHYVAAPLVVLLALMALRTSAARPEPLRTHARPS